MEDAFDPDRPVIIVGGRPTPWHPHSSPSHISKTVPPTIHLGPPEVSRHRHRYGGRQRRALTQFHGAPTPCSPARARSRSLVPTRQARGLTNKSVSPAGVLATFPANANYATRELVWVPARLGVSHRARRLPSAMDYS